MYKILVLCLLMATSASAQLGGWGNVATDAVNKSIKNKKQKKADKEREAFIAKNLQTRVLGSDTVKVLRATKENSSEYAVHIQEELDKIHQKLVSEPHADLSTTILSTRTKMVILQEQKNDYPIEFYKSEALFYDDYNVKKRKEKQELERVQREAELERQEIERQKQQIAENQRIREAHRAKEIADSLETLRITKGYHFANAPKIYFYAKAEKGQPIGEAGQACYIVVVDTVAKKGFLKVAFGEKFAFIDTNAVVDNIFKLSDKTTYSYQTALKRHYEPITIYKDFSNTTTVITPTETRSNAKNAPTYNQTETQRVWHTGPNGGVYYINENGNKVYKKKSKK